MPVLKSCAASIAAAVAVLAAGAAIAADPPRPAFDQDVHPPAPDYRQPSAWAALPTTPDAADLAPANSRLPEAQATAGADVFYVYPTTLRERAHWNQDLTDEATNRWTDISVIARQASAFNACCRIYAPRYRQAGPGSSAAMDGDGGKAYDLAYQDVKSAFLYYLDHDNHGRPFILAGHSQGGLLVARLVAEMIDGKPLQRRFVAAYAIGVPISLGDFGGKYASVPSCAKPTQTGCIVNWNTFARAGDPSDYRRQSEARNASRYGPQGRALLCVNPLTFDLDRPSASAAANLGTLTGEPKTGDLPRLSPGASGAECIDGVLMADLPRGPDMAWTTLPQGMMHMHDIDTFYENLRENAVARVKAFLATPAR